MDHSQLSSLVLKSPLGLTPAFQVNLNAVTQGSSPLLSPVLSDAGGTRIEEDDETKRKVRSELGTDGVRWELCWALRG